MEREKDEAYIQESQKRDGFKDEQYFIIPTESFKEYLKHPLVKAMYLTDIGFFPKAYHHYREREEGTEEYILLYCTEGEGYIHIGNKKYHLGTLQGRKYRLLSIGRIPDYSDEFHTCGE